MLNKKETREKQKEMKTGRRKFKLDEVYDIGVKAKQVWEEVIYRYITLYSQTDPIKVISCRPIVLFTFSLVSRQNDNLGT